MPKEPPPDSYKCLACDVFGVGKKCWLCDGDMELTEGYAPVWGQSHRNDPSKREVAVGGGVVVIRSNMEQLFD